jgi:hypothetical protein
MTTDEIKQLHKGVFVAQRIMSKFQNNDWRGAEDNRQTCYNINPDDVVRAKAVLEQISSLLDQLAEMRTE